jgi:oxygen-dependent protoporphyrinogen oxidase
MWNVLVRDKPAPDMRDISIGEEFLRLGGRREPIDNAISAMCHGIYGGDVWKLSAESCFTSADFMNRRIRKRIRAATKTSAAIKEKWVTVLDQDLRLLSDLVPKNAAVTKVLSLSHEIKSINFVNGFSSLTDAIVAKLKATGNVKFIYERVGKVRLSATDKLEVCLSAP